MRFLLLMIALAGLLTASSRVQGGSSSEELRTLNTDTITDRSSGNVDAVLDPASSSESATGVPDPAPTSENATAPSPTSENATAPAPSSENATAVSGPAFSLGPSSQEPDADAEDKLEYLVPELEGNLFSVSAGPRGFANRLSFSPGFGQIGDEPLYLFRIGYNPNHWLGWEAHIGHNRGESVHALFHFLNAHLRYPLAFRVQPYLSGGFGIVMVYPGNSVNSDPVTENALSGGAGLELYLREDVALRGEWRRIGVFGRDPFTQESTTYSYGEATLGLTFYRRIGS